VAKVVVSEKARGKAAARDYSFAVVFEPLTLVDARRKNSRKVPQAQNPSLSGYQVTVPLFPGVITYGRTLAEAREMARDAILRDYKQTAKHIPNERN